ncbi:hypothetical protein BC936DRAFT_139977 [Jimgerdemannia flammicorona]|uniref:Uncharacterized protein n=1 Tax=Jimgerdemannia flammicorona TaxID=994334 RepID=A0A433DH88_9FUNG|nr:hypothetical protein BC936DRAFT_139977 [Jimgerdemannia flammicorona]
MYATTQFKNPNVKLLTNTPHNAADGARSFSGVVLWEASVAWIYQDVGHTFGPSKNQYIKIHGTCGAHLQTNTIKTTTSKTSITLSTITSTSTETSTSTVTSTKTSISTAIPALSNCPINGGSCTTGQPVRIQFCQCNNGMLEIH